MLSDFYALGRILRGPSLMQTNKKKLDFFNGVYMRAVQGYMYIGTYAETHTSTIYKKIWKNQNTQIKLGEWGLKVIFVHISHISL